MSSPQVSSDAATEASRAAAVPMRFEVTVLPVADDDRDAIAPPVNDFRELFARPAQQAQWDA